VYVRRPDHFVATFSLKSKKIVKPPSTYQRPLNQSFPAIIQMEITFSFHPIIGGVRGRRRFIFPKSKKMVKDNQEGQKEFKKETKPDAGVEPATLRCRWINRLVREWTHKSLTLYRLS
jgi:hypothetical protein